MTAIGNDMDYSELKRLAEAAKALDHNENDGWYRERSLMLGRISYPKNARFMAAASPDVVLGLLAEVERLAVESKAHFDNWHRSCELVNECDKKGELMRTQNQSLLEALERIGNWGGTTRFTGSGSYTDVARAAIAAAEGKDV